MKIDGSFYIKDAVAGSINCSQMEVRKDFRLMNFRFNNSINVSRAIIGSNFEMTNIEMNEPKQEGSYGLAGARIKVGGIFKLEKLVNFRNVIGLRFSSFSGGITIKDIYIESTGGEIVGLRFDGSDVTGDFVISGEIAIDSIISLEKVSIHGSLQLDANIDDAARKGILVADDIVVDGSVYLTRHFKFLNKISFDGARISNNFRLVGAEVGKFFARNVKVGNLLTLRSLRGKRHEFNFASSSTRVLQDEIESWCGDFNIDGFEYESFADVKSMNVANRLHWMECAMTNRSRENFSSQPWKMLQTVLRNAGHSSKASKVGYAYESKLLKHGDFDTFGKIAHYLYGVFTGYGYRCMRLLWWSLGVWLFFGLFYWYTASQHAVFSPTNPLIFKRDMYPGCFSDVAIDVNNRAAHLDRIKFEKFSILYNLNFLSSIHNSSFSIKSNTAEK